MKCHYFELFLHIMYIAINDNLLYPLYTKYTVGIYSFYWVLWPLKMTSLIFSRIRLLGGVTVDE